VNKPSRELGSLSQQCNIYFRKPTSTSAEFKLQACFAACCELASKEPLLRALLAQ
jgi:hypothetical protein